MLFELPFRDEDLCGCTSVYRMGMVRSCFGFGTPKHS